MISTKEVRDIAVRLADAGILSNGPTLWDLRIVLIDAEDAGVISTLEYDQVKEWIDFRLKPGPFQFASDCENSDYHRNCLRAGRLYSGSSPYYPVTKDASFWWANSAEEAFWKMTRGEWEIVNEYGHLSWNWHSPHDEADFLRFQQNGE